MRLLRLRIAEPIAGQVLPELAASHGDEEACRRYRAVIVTTLRQLRGLRDTRIQILADPEDADDAIKFWLLPRLADTWRPLDDAFQSDGWLIGFGDHAESGYRVVATGEALCPWLGARWVHTAMIGLDQGRHQSVGHSPDGQCYFAARHPGLPAGLTPRPLPPLTIIRNADDWQQAIDSPLGAGLKKAWLEEGD